MIMAARSTNFVLLRTRFWTHRPLARCLLHLSQRSLMSPRCHQHCPLRPFKRHLHQPLRGYSSSLANTRPLFLQVLKQEYGDKLAIVDSLGQHSYNDLLEHSTALSPYIIANARGGDKSSPNGSGVTLHGERIAFLCPNNALYVIAQWAIWMAGGMAVPLCKDHPPAEIEYVVEDSQSSLLISTPTYKEKIQSVADKLDLKNLVLNECALNSTNLTGFESELSVDSIPQILHSNNADSLNLEVLERRILTEKWHQMKWRSRNALLIYTSGTTGRPKGVVTTFNGYQAQVAMMVQAWRWTASDVVLHTLPLHHVHGIVNVLGCPLWVGATCVMLPKFDASKVWDLLTSNDNPRINVFMAVPTIYAKLIEYYNTKYQSSNVQMKAFIEALLKERVRVMVSGSAALPQPIMEEWKQITGHSLLERYGMTELGMALSNPLHGQRVPGAVGTPMPSVQVRIVDHHGDVLVEGNSHRSKVKKQSVLLEGDLQVKGPAVFKEYWNKPEATAETFTSDGWFKTGDTAKYEEGIYRILGRTSVDIIKSGGYKISALDIERHLLSHPRIAECAVVGIPDVTWGQQVAAIVVLKPYCGLTLAILREWARDKMAPYIIPTQLKVVKEIPRNAMGKVNKKQLCEVFGFGQAPINPTNARLSRVLFRKKE